MNAKKHIIIIKEEVLKIDRDYVNTWDGLRERLENGEVWTIND